MGTAINLDEIKRVEVTEVYSHPDAKVDIVLVHGLNGDPRRTWTSAKNDVFWPTQLLPASLKSAQARILVYGYNADVYAFGSGRSPSSDMIYQHAQSLITNLANERELEETTENPIIFVAHSLGGILVKRALELSNDLTSRHADRNRKIYISTYGIIFLGTPHTGADPAKWGLMLEKMVHTMIPKKIMHSDAQLVKTLQTNNETLQNINLHFLDIYQRFRVCMAHEEMQTDLKGTNGFIVDQTSASPMLPDVTYFGIASTHSGMCKFESKNSPGYLNVSTTLKSWVQDAPQTIKPRIELENRQREDMRRAQAAEILGIFPNTPNLSTGANTPAVTNPSSMNNSTIIVQSTASIAPDEEPNPNAPYFIKPSGFRPNSLFVGRATELAELHKLLFDKKKRAEGTSAVLIQSMPGGGKTHLARQYVYMHKDEFPGGVFWLRAKSQSEIAAGFWDIARKATFKDKAASSPVDPGSMKDPQNFIKLVKKWLNHREGWLMVFDGIHFDDPEGLKRFIPDHPNTSLIYTSTEKSASGDHHFMNPQLLRLPALSAREAQVLLLKELDKREPFTKDDLQNSMELVQSISFLPVVIHAVAQRLRLTDEHLGRFAKSYASEPRLRGLATYIAVVRQLHLLGAHEALNLMYMLCFFSQHIPVEMIHLGLRYLDEKRIPIRASEPMTGSTLNNTFKMLNTFALIDRNDQGPSLQSSQSSKGSADMLADNIDVIRLHSVVQGFFSDTLLADKDAAVFPLWLGRAVQVFCCSYDMASERITRKTNAGLVEDYRLYEIHGIRLKEHVTRHEKKFSLKETLAMLDQRLALIKMEIERRTPESANFIAGGKPDAFLTSIFDRTSSSSETGPDTPLDLKLISAGSSWSMEPGMSKHESPTSILGNGGDFRQPLQDRQVPFNKFPALPVPEDPGYDSDHEGTAMATQPSQRTLLGDPRSPISPGGAWETVKPRRPKMRPAGKLDPHHHRTTRTLEKQRYSDSAGAFRSMNPPDPRAINPHLSHISAERFENATPTRDPSRGRNAGKSSAQVALEHISNSPPPSREGVSAHRKSLSRGSNGSRMISGITSYAAAVLSSTKDTASSYRQPIPIAPEPAEHSTENGSRVGASPRSSAMDALRHFPIEAISPTSPRTSPPTFTPMPPYPETPTTEYDQPILGAPYPHTIPAPFNNENNTLAPNPPTAYPRRMGPIPYEIIQSTPLSPHPPNFTTWTSQPPSSFYQSQPRFQFQNPPPLSLSSPDIRFSSNDNTYIPGHPEFSSFSPTTNNGYTSQPMSRDPSGQSGHSAGAINLGGQEDRRRPSLAETEPMPQLPIFSPRIAPTSYQVYERMRGGEIENEMWDARNAREESRWERRRGSSLERGMLGRRSPAFGVRRRDGWAGEENTLPPPRRFNPTATPFAPSPSALANPYSTSPNPALEAPEMGRSGSGGVRIGRRVIGFGDSEAVDLETARERAERGRQMIEREESGLEGLGLGLGR